MVFPFVIENKILECKDVKEAIIIAGDDKKNVGYQVPFLFVVPEKDSNQEKLNSEIRQIIDTQLLEEEKPKDIFFLEEKPIKAFKTDKKILQKKYNL